MTYYIYVERGKNNSRFISKEFGDFIDPVLTGLGIVSFAKKIVQKEVGYAKFREVDCDPMPLDEKLVLGKILIPVEI